MRTVNVNLLVPPGVGREDVIADFRGPYRWLSNFHVADVEFEGLTYRSTEHAYQAAKTLNPLLRSEIQHAPEPKDAKRLGGEVHLRPDWEKVKSEVMLEVVRQKFTRHPELRQALLETDHKSLIEGNWWHDTYWGRCTCANHHGAGLNRLGDILMTVRSELRKAGE